VVGFGSSTADPDAEGRQEYYAGGASSGAAILDPAKKEKDIFKRLQAQAAAQGPYDGASAAPPGAAAPAGAAAAGHSWGSGASLGGDGKDSQQFGASPGGAAAAAAAAAAAPGQVSQIVITRYSDGFTVDMGDGEGEGPVRRPDQPGNAMFLQALEQGKVCGLLRSVASVDTRADTPSFAA
jgi:UBX domain-containing protein 1